MILVLIDIARIITDLFAKVLQAPIRRAHRAQFRALGYRFVSQRMRVNHEANVRFR
jgi:hypothetical protein